jgi:hypothetical protein
MTRPTLLAGQILALLTVCMVAVGCLPCHWCPPGCPVVPPRPLPPEVLRSSMAQRILSQPAPANPATFRSIRTDAFPYHAMSPLDCQCEAVAHAPLADTLDEERQRIEKRAERGKGKYYLARQLEAAIFYYLALEIRNDASGLALTWYYRIAGGEVAVDLTTEGINEVNNALLKIDEMRRLQLHLPVEIEKVWRESLRLQEELAQSQLEVEQFNEKLHQVLDHGCDPAWRIWPEPLPPGGSLVIPDVDTAVSVGLAQRPYLKLLRYLLNHLDEDMLDSIKASLGMLARMMAKSQPTDCKPLNELIHIFFPHAGRRTTLESIHKALCTTLRREEAHVASVIRQSIYAMRAHHEKTVLAQQQVQRWDTQIAKIDQKITENLVSSLERVDPVVDRLKSRGDVCKEWLLVLASQAKLQQAQGLLVKECLCPGSTLPLLAPTEGSLPATHPELETAPSPTQVPEEKATVLPQAE